MRADRNATGGRFCKVDECRENPPQQRARLKSLRIGYALETWVLISMTS